MARRETPHPTKLSDTDKNLVAVLTAAISDVAPRASGPMPDDSSAKMARIVDEKAQLLTAQFQNAINANCGSCQKPGGAMHAASEKLDRVLESLAVQRGKRELITFLSPLVMVLVGGLVIAFVNYKFGQFRDLQIQASGHVSMTSKP